MTLDRARRLADYWKALGISHLYLSPVLRARRGSSHGYDVVDPTRVDPVLGGEPALERLSSSLAQRGIRLLLDIVPNHMAAVPENPYFADVLVHGPSSVFAHWFDIDWRISRRGTHSRLVLPVLGESRKAAIRAQRLRVILHDGVVCVTCPGHVFPVDPATLPDLLGDVVQHLRSDATSGVFASVLARMRELPPRSARSTRATTWRAREAADSIDALRALLRESIVLHREIERALRALSKTADGRARLARFLHAQAYRLDYWRVARRALNYRRFFNIDALIALGTEDPTVFASSHGLVLELAARGIVDGLRLDHVDGLLEPGVYIARLRAAIERRLGATRARAFPIYVEKILGLQEKLPPHWNVQGTTGYEFLGIAEDVFINPGGYTRINKAWEHLTGLPGDFHEVALAEKRRVLAESLKPDIDRLVELLHTLRPDEAADIGNVELEAVVCELIARLPVYRVYLEADVETLTEDACVTLAQAFACLHSDPSLSPRAIRFLEASLGIDAPARKARPASALVIKRLGQRSGPAAAKGIEDAAFYIHVPLVSRNDVGSSPEAPLRESVTRFHEHNAVVSHTYPATLLAATTHDTKRSSDTRSRLDVLSELADDWNAAVTRWRLWNAPLRSQVSGGEAPDTNTEYLAYQSLLAIWPVLVDGTARYGVPPAPVLASLQHRLRAYMEKAAREASRRTTWTQPRDDFEQALGRFLDGMLLPGRHPRGGLFLRDFAAFASRTVRPGFWGALSKLVLQLTAPGIPDIYQGEETWNLTLVDPDNRRSVDFARLKRTLSGIVRMDRLPQAKREREIRKLAATLEDGRLKTYVLRRGLLARRELASLFSRGSYQPLATCGPRAGHVVAFARRVHNRVVVVAVTRLALTLTGDAFTDPVGESIWEGTSILLPKTLAPRVFRSALDGRTVRSSGSGPHRVIPLADGFATLPFAVLSA
jgi:(1->4)-alpha-D-glucan 1-alpha-D-glucosylmutase